jgi:hypothetical protein
VIGAAIANASTNSHKAPSARADCSTSPMNPGVTSRPVAREIMSQPITTMTIATIPITTFCQVVQRSAR